MPANPPAIRALGAICRRVGQAFDRVGLALQDKHGYVEGLVPSTRVVPFKGKSMKYGVQNFVASTGSVVGDVNLGELSSVWYGATVRGDKAAVTIGKNSAVLDNATVSTPAGPVRIGSDVVVSPGAIVQSAEIGDGTMIGMGAVIMPGAKVGNDCFIDGGAVVPAGTVVPSGQLWLGNPAKQLRTLTTEEMAYLRSSAVNAATLSQLHFEQSLKSVERLEEEVEEQLMKEEMGLNPSDALPEQDADVVEYYKLTAPKHSVNEGLFRDQEYDQAAERALAAAEEIAADKKEMEYYNKLARVRRVGRAMAQLAAAKADRATAAGIRERVLSELAASDPVAARELQGLVAEIGEAATSGSAERKSELVEVIKALDAEGIYADEAEQAAAAAGMFEQLAGHSKALKLQ